MKENRTKKRYQVSGMDCADCALHVEKEVSRLPGIANVSVNAVTGLMDIDFDRTAPDDRSIVKAVRGAGYDAEPADPGPDARSRRTGGERSAYDRRLMIGTVIAAILVFGGIIAGYLNMPETVVQISILAGLAAGGYPIFRKGLREARVLQPGMNFLMSLAVVGALVIGEYQEAGMVIVLFAVAQLLESRAMAKARRSISSLMSMRPEKALVIRGDRTEAVEVEQVLVGDRVAVRPGDRIPVDGIVTDGHSWIDQSAVTGESMPVSVAPESRVYAGTMNTNGLLEIRVDRPYDQSTFSRIIQLVEEAQAKKAPSQYFVERFARFYTPLVIAMAVLVVIIPPLFFGESLTELFYRALVLLVIACPCAFVISTPVTIVSGLTNAMRRGILIKGGAVLENLARLTAFAFDKTGTLTENRPVVQEIIPLNGYPVEDLLAIAAAIESRTDHPLAEAFVRKAESLRLKLPAGRNLKMIAGRGVEAEVDGTGYIIGNHQLFEDRGLCRPEVHERLSVVEDADHTVVLMGTADRVIAIFSISDQIRPGIKATITELRAEGVRHTAMITGDNHRTAEAIAEESGIMHVHAGLLPADKLRVIDEIRRVHGPVAMVGDGINDAPALAAADIGIAMGAGGSDTALETADIALMNDDLRNLAGLKRLSNITLRVIKQNIAVALGLKFVFLFLAIPGWATLWMAVFADMGASLIVIFNGMRVLGFRK